MPRGPLRARPRARKVGNVSETPLPLRREPSRPLDPADELLALHDTTPVARLDGRRRSAWLVTRHDHAREVLADAERFSNRAPDGDGRPGVIDEGFMLGMDPPEHTRLRRMLTGAFTVRRVRTLEPQIAAIVRDHLDAMAAAGPPADLVQAFALPVPSLVICELLGVPYADRADFQRRSRTVVDFSADRETQAANAAEMRAYMTGLVAAARKASGDDLLGALIREHGDDLTDGELAGLGNLLLLAGHETTANMLGLGTLTLLRNPDQLAAVRDDPAAVDGAVEELLRYLSIVAFGVAKHVTRDLTFHGQAMRAGDPVIVSLPAANRDPALAEEPGSLDVARAAGPHVAFGYGVHHCLGAPLARAEMRIAFPALLRRFPGLRLAVPPERVRYRGASVVYGVEELPVAW
ncbi:MAG: cytochrome P450 [Streptosporangiales bacterium]|nr:cytochrome P450 [Streptosporangiales bacterium]